ncbi:MAG TPA: rhomboid family intramembrane serine protease [Myxococcaceae bacterium]|nr:rhomboid family intramembrane serine protease [Myxococcaceae bacterium]
MRSSGGYGGGGGFGGFQLRLTTVSAKLAVGLVVGTVLSTLGMRGWLALVPDRVFHGFAVWQPLTYAFVASGALDLIFGALILYSIGGVLESIWGPRRLLRFALGTTAVSGLLTLLVALVVPSLRLTLFPGGWAMTTSLWVAYGLFIGRGPANFWGLPTTGNVLALIGVGFVALNFLQGAGQAIPAVFACAITFAYMRGLVPSPKRLQLRFQDWRLRRQARSRAKHLKVVGGKDVNTSPRGSDRYLH